MVSDGRSGERKTPSVACIPDLFSERNLNDYFIGGDG